MSLKVGDIAPDFAVNDQSGRQVKLSDFKGKKWFCISIRKIIPPVAPPKPVTCETTIRH
jgi:peroxiredoxin